MLVGSYNTEESVWSAKPQQVFRYDLIFKNLHFFYQIILPDNSVMKLFIALNPERNVKLNSII